VVKRKGDKVINEIESENNMMSLAESAILYANRDRQHLSDIHHLVLQSEAHFNEANFEKAMSTRATPCANFAKAEASAINFFSIQNMIYLDNAATTRPRRELMIFFKRLKAKCC
jgi:hypothetical protein